LIEAKRPGHQEAAEGRKVTGIVNWSSG